MSLYSFVLFLHIAGAITLFMGFAIEWNSLRHLQRVSRLDQARVWVNASSGVRPFSMAGMFVLVLAGGYLARRMEAWHESWVWVALAATFAIAGIAVALTQRRMREIRNACDVGQAELTEALTRRLRDPILRVSLGLRTAIALGIVLLMTVKPTLGISLLIVAIAAVGGILPSLLTRGRYQLGNASVEEV
jgi:hypothetical protein